MDDGRAQCVSAPRPRASASSSQRFLQPTDLNRRRCIPKNDVGAYGPACRCIRVRPPCTTSNAGGR